MLRVDGDIEQLAISWNQPIGFKLVGCDFFKINHINQTCREKIPLQIDAVNDRNMKWQLEIRGWLADDSEQVLFDNTLPSTKTMKLQKIFLCMRGLAVVEMAVVIPVFLIIVFGILEFGIVLYDKAIITNASLQLAQAGSQITSTSQLMGPSQSDICNVVCAVQGASGSGCSRASCQATTPDPVNKLIGDSLISFGGGTVAANVPDPSKTQRWDGLGYPFTVTVSFSYRSLVLAPLMRSLKMPGPWDSNNSIGLSSTTTMYLN